MELNPGPLENELLHAQEDHVSNFLWENEKFRNKLKTNESNQYIQRFRLNKEQKQLLVDVGFGAFTNVFITNQFDAALISALVERWRSETNTFHFPVGEMSLTLEDVYFILGLPVCGEPIILRGPRKPRYLISGSSFSKYLDGTSRTKKEGGLVMSWLAERFAELPANYTLDDLVQYTKAYILVVIGSVLVPDSSIATVHASWLPFVDDLGRIRGYAWGAAVLANLYRGLAKACTHNAHSINGCLTLLQVWAYERISIGRPIFEINRTLFPRATAWVYRRSSAVHTVPHRQYPHHNIHNYRECFDALQECDVNWTPYTHFHNQFSECNENRNVMDVYPGHEKESALLSGIVRTPLICMDVVEYQLPERYVRQFGELQDIPIQPPEDMLDLRVDPRGGKPGKVIDAYDIRRKYVCIWMAWQRTIPEELQLSITSVDTINQYLQWYRRVTRLRVDKPKLPDESGYVARGYIGWSEAVLMLRTARMKMQWLLDHPGERQPDSVYNNWVTQYMYFAAKYEGRHEDSNLHYSSTELPQQFFCPSPMPQSSPNQSDFPYPQTFSGPEAPDVAMYSTPVPQSKERTVPLSEELHRSTHIPIRELHETNFLCTPPYTFKNSTPGGLFNYAMHEAPKHFFSTQTSGIHVTSDPIDVDDYSPKKYHTTLQSSRNKPVPPPNFPSFLSWNKAERMEGKHPCKPLKLERTNLIRETVFSRPTSTTTFPLSHTKYVLNDFEAFSLRPGEELFDTVIESYSHLLKDRENRRLGFQSNSFFVPPFLSSAMRERFRLERGSKSKKTRAESAEHIRKYLSHVDGWEKIHEIEKVFLPFHTGISGESGHYILFVVDLSVWQVWLIDPLYDNTKTDPYKERYADEIGSVKKLFPAILRMLVHNRDYATGDLKLTYVTSRPKQHNGVDCGVFVYKYMNYLLQGYILANLNWSNEDVECFRYRIVSELLNGCARKCRVM